MAKSAGNSEKFGKNQRHVKVLIQRVSSACVVVEDVTVGKIDAGLLIFLGVAKGDTSVDIAYLVQKVAHLRLFNDADGKMNLSLLDIKGSALVVSQFTLYGDCRKGRRPSFDQAAPPDIARGHYEEFVDLLKKLGIPVETGVFQADMKVHLVNNGPVTISCESNGS